jgi:hypothetical protein
MELLASRPVVLIREWFGPNGFHTRMSDWIADVAR